MVEKGTYNIIECLNLGCLGIRMITEQFVLIDARNVSPLFENLLTDILSC